jgi:hypothetical protein
MRGAAGHKGEVDPQFNADTGGAPRVRATIVLIGAVLAGTACSGAAQLVLKGPIEDRCSEAGLKGCEPLTDGVLEYVDGDREEAMRKIKKGIAQNTPDQVREFAAGLRALKSIPGADQYIHPLLEVADLLAPDQGEARVVPHKARGHAKPVAATDDEPATGQEASTDGGLTVTNDGGPAAEPLAGTTVPSVDEDAVPCVPFAGTRVDVGNVVGRCATVATGPLVVTDVWTTGTCANDLFVGAGVPGRPRWAISSAASAPLSVHGANLPVADGESLFVAQAAPSLQALRHDLRCAVTWAALRR